MACWDIFKKAWAKFWDAPENGLETTGVFWESSGHSGLGSFVGVLWELFGNLLKTVAWAASGHPLEINVLSRWGSSGNPLGV